MKSHSLKKILKNKKGKFAIGQIFIDAEDNEFCEPSQYVYLGNTDDKSTCLVELVIDNESASIVYNWNDLKNKSIWKRKFKPTKQQGHFTIA